MFNCVSCNRTWENVLKVKLNGVSYCPNCILLYIYNNHQKLLKINTLEDNDYVYKLSKDVLIRFLLTNLTQEEYFKLKSKYPRSWYLHDDFYDEEGYSLQPKEV